MSYQDLQNRRSAQTESAGSGYGESLAMEMDDSFDLQEYMTIIRRRRKLIIATLCIVLVGGLVFTLTRRPIYESSAKIVVVTHNSASPSTENDIPLVSDLAALTQSRSIDTQKEIIESQDLLDKAYRTLSPKLREKGFGKDTRKEGFGKDDMPAWVCDVEAKKETDVLTVTCKAYDPNIAALLANTIAETYFEQDVERNSKATRQARIYAEDQMAVIGKDLQKAEKILSDYKQKIGIVDAPTQLQKTAENMAHLQLDADTAKADYAANKRAIEGINKQIAGEHAQILETSTVTRDPQYAATLDNINQLQIKRASALQEYTPNSKEVRELEGQIKSEQARLNKIAETLVASQVFARNPVHETLVGNYLQAVVNDSVLAARIKAVVGILEDMNKEAMELPEKDRGLSERTQRVELLRSTYSLLSDKYYTLLLTERSVMPAGELVSKARPAESPTSPQKKKDMALFLLLGILVSAIVTVIAEKLDVRVHDQALVERMTGLPTLAVVPLTEDETPRLISAVEQNSTMLESYRILRSNIAFSSIDREMKLLAVTSPGQGEGKSTTAANLAIAMAIDGKKVLLIDCDLRRPSLHRLFGVSRSIGFTNVVTGKTRLEDAIVSTKTENLQILPSGPIPPNPPEVLNSNHTRELLKTLSNQYDIIIMDCPPCTGLSDVQVISTLCEGLLVVVAINQSLRPHLEITMRALSHVEAPFVGTVLNKMDVFGNGYYYYYYYSSYNYGTDDGEQDKQSPGYKRKRCKSEQHSKKP